MKYRYRAVERFGTSFYRLPPAQKESDNAKHGKFSRKTPFDPRLRTHKIQRLSANYGRTIYAIEIEGDLRLLFYLDGETVVSLIIGTHDLYKS